MIDCAPPVSDPIVWVSPCLPDKVVCSLPDIDQDGIVGITDFLFVIEHWGESDCSIYRKGDIDQDGDVGIVDLLIVLDAWVGYSSATWNRCDCGGAG